MLDEKKPPYDLLDYLEGLPTRIINQIDSFEIVQKNSIFGILDTTLNDEVSKLNAALPNTVILPIRGIGSQTITSDTINIRFNIFNTLGFSYSDGTEIAICSNGNHAIEIVSFKISRMKKEKGLDEILMDYLLSYLHLSLLFIPEIIVRIVDVEPKSDAQIEFFKKFNFKIHQKLDNYILLKRNEEQFIIS